MVFRKIAGPMQINLSGEVGMSATRKGSGASAEDCGCDGKASNRATDPKRESWGRVLNSLWPRGMPFPPAAPWAGAVVKRSQLAAVIENESDSLPSLPISAVGLELHPENLEVIAELVGRGMTAQPPQGTQKTRWPGRDGLGGRLSIHPDDEMSDDQGSVPGSRGSSGGDWWLPGIYAPSYLSPCPSACSDWLNAEHQIDYTNLLTTFCDAEDLECLDAAAAANTAAWHASDEARETYCQKDCNVPECGGQCPENLNS